MADTTWYGVQLNGSYTSGSFSPAPDPASGGGWTFNWTEAASDSYAYERLLDSGQAYVRTARHPGNVANLGAEFDLEAPSFEHFVEDLAHDPNAPLYGKHSMACPGPGGCFKELRWRIIDH